MEGLGVGRGSQRHRAVLTLADNERNTFVFTVFGELPASRENTLAKGERFQAVAGRLTPDSAVYV